MDLKIDKVKGHGDAAHEWVRLRASADCDVGHYIIVDNTYYANGKVSNELRNSFWFPDKDIKEGDYVILRTGEGVDGTSEMTDRTPLHEFFWGLNSPVWNDSGDAITLIHADTWTFQKVDE